MPAQTALDTKAEPVAVILVGGIFASHLVDPRGGLAWPVNRTPAMLRHIIDSPAQQRSAFSEEKAVRFLARGPRSILPSTPPSHVDAASGWQDVFLDSYSAFLTACANAGPNTDPALPFQPFVYALGYNFTRSNRVTSWRYIVPQTLHILQAVRTAANKLQVPPKPADDGPLPRFIFVTHSMGALAVRYTLKRNPALRKSCICVVHVAAPNAGAPETLARFVRGSKDHPPVSLIFGNRGWKCLTSASTIGAGFELLPFPMLRKKGAFKDFDVITPVVSAPTDPAFHFEKIINTQFADPGPAGRTVRVTTTLPGAPDSFSIPDTGDIFRYRTAQKQKDAITSEIISGRTDGQGRLIPGHLKAAQSFHDELGDYLFERTGAVVLDGIPTVQKIQFTFNAGGTLTDVIETVSMDGGDGTVPKESQRYLIPTEFVGKGGVRFDPIVRLTGVAHADALSGMAETKDPRFANMFGLIRDLYHAAPPANLAVPVSTETLNANVKTLLAAFHAGGS